MKQSFGASLRRAPWSPWVAVEPSENRISSAFLQSALRSTSTWSGRRHGHITHTV